MKSQKFFNRIFSILREKLNAFTNRLSIKTSKKFSVLAFTTVLLVSFSVPIVTKAQQGVIPGISYEGEFIPGAVIGLKMNYPSSSSQPYVKGQIIDGNGAVIADTGWRGMTKDGRTKVDTIGVSVQLPVNMPIGKDYQLRVQGFYREGSGQGIYTNFFTKTVHSAGLSLPFQAGKTWYVCRGYNIGNYVGGKYVGHVGIEESSLDLSTVSNSFVTGGCDLKTNNAATGSSVTSPGDGTVKLNLGSGHRDFVCVKLSPIGDRTGDTYLLIGHITPESTIGSQFKPIKRGELIGKVNAPGVESNNGYAHIHIQANAQGCYSGSALDFSDQSKLTFAGVPSLPNDKKTNNQHSGTKLTRPTLIGGAGIAGGQ